MATATRTSKHQQACLVKVKKPLQKPCANNLAQRRIDNIYLKQIKLKTLQSRRLLQGLIKQREIELSCDISTCQYQSSSGLLRYQEFTEIYSNRYIKQNNKLARASRFFYIPLPLLHNYDVKMPNFTFYGRRKQATAKFSFSLFKLECGLQEINSGEITLHQTFSANWNN